MTKRQTDSTEESRPVDWAGVGALLWLVAGLAMLLRGGWLLSVELRYLASGAVAQAEVLSA